MKRTFNIQKYWFLSGLICFSVLYPADTGNIIGRVVDAASGAPLAGANIVLKETITGTSSDVNGEFEFRKVPAGEQKIIASYIGHESAEIVIFVTPGRTVMTQIKLDIKTIELESVPVVAGIKGSQDGGLLIKQKKSLHIEDGISAAQMSRSGDSNAAEALRRITGASVREGKFVTVRGLGGRYVDAQVNGGPVASPEPDKKSLPLTLFPAAILESISIIKTYSPDLPGIFGGGFVSINTKAYPDEYILKLKFSVKDNSNLHRGRLFLQSGGETGNYWGYGNANRGLPKDIPDDRMLNLWSPPVGVGYDNWRLQLSRYGQEFKTSFRYKTEQMTKPISIDFNIGNHYNPAQNLEYGYFLNGSFSNNYQILDARLATFSLSGSGYVPTHEVENSSSVYKTNLALGFSSGIKWKKNNLKIYYLYTHSSSDKMIYGSGFTPNIENGVFIKQKFSEKSIRNLTLSGSHQFSKVRSLTWKINFGDSHLFEPDEKSHNYSQVPGLDEFTLVVSSSKAGERSFTSGADVNGNLDIDYSNRFDLGSLKDLTVKLGLREQERRRHFQRRSFYHLLYGTDNQNSYLVTGDDFGSIFSNDHFLSESAGGWILVENTDASGRSAYHADERVSAQYAMVSFPVNFSAHWIDEIRFISGLRRELYAMELVPYNGVTGIIYENPLLPTGSTLGKINETVFLPSFTMITGFPKNFKLRLAFSHTVARPQFRELAPLEYQEYYGGDVVVGYQNLKTTGITNFDLRVEWYPARGELISFSSFVKLFTDPIETARFETADLVYKTFQNSAAAEARGIELEIRKQLSLLSSLGSMLVVFNSTWSESRVKRNALITLFNGETIANSAHSRARPLQGQSNIIVNTEINFKTYNDLSVSVAFNTYSKRLASLGSGNVADEYEYPFPSLNLTVLKTIKSFSINMKVSNMLNSSIRFGQLEPGGKLKLTRTYQPGQRFSIGAAYDF
ncbi:MAG: TonB-dependent receptor plug domain-containing protein [FCB group bacterium]|nr:TonB-dependent receptor plug domain-containing protein [FCB group bacterium]